MGKLAKDFQELIVWQKSHQLALAVYKITQQFPASEQFGLTNQMRRAAVSVPSNIAEGFERYSKKEFHQFLIIARGSVAELQAQMLLSQSLGYLSEESQKDFSALSIEVHKMINSMCKNLRTS